MELTYKDIYEAAVRIEPYVSKTQLEKSIYLSNKEKNVFLKMECQQPIKAFKIRGAFNRILKLSDAEKEKGVAAVSSGNHGIAISYVSQKLGMRPALVVVPENTPESKVEKIEYYGGKVVKMGNCFDDAYKLGMSYINDKGYTFVDGWDSDKDVYAGQGTVALELLSQNPDIDTIIMPIGGGSLMTSSAVAAKYINPGIKIIGVYSERCKAWADSVRDNVLYNEYPSGESICEAMVGGIGHLAFECRCLVDDTLCVEEAAIKEAMAYAVLKEKIVAEAAGAVPIAAFMQYGDIIKGKNIGLIISGGNADNNVLIEALKNR